MSNEEKILDMLQAMTTRLDNLETEIKASESHMMTMMESLFTPQFNMLAEKMDILEEKMLPSEALGGVEERVDVLEAAVKQHSREIRELKKAQ